VAYYHNMIGGPSDVEGAEDVDVTLKKPGVIEMVGPAQFKSPNLYPDDVDVAETWWNTPDMIKHRACHIVSELKSTGIKILDHSLGGHTEGNSLN